MNDAIDKIDELICTNESKMEDVAYNYIQESGSLQNMPESLQYYFDYEGFGRDLEINGSYFKDNENILWEYIA